jgi:AcrR family transcriptional regulator
MPRHKRRAHEVERIREHILNAAAQAFAREGYDRTTMGNIAAEAGYTAPTLYAYFKGKADIFEALVGVVVGAALRTFDAKLPTGLGFGHRVELLLQKQLDMFEEHSAALGFFVALKPTDVAPVREDETTAAKGHENVELDQRARRWFEENLDSDSDADAEVLATFYRGTVDAFLLRWVAQGQPGRPHDWGPLVLDLFLRGAASQTQQ